MHLMLRISTPGTSRSHDVVATVEPDHTVGELLAALQVLPDVQGDTIARRASGQVLDRESTLVAVGLAPGELVVGGADLGHHVPAADRAVRFEAVGGPASGWRVDLGPGSYYLGRPSSAVEHDPSYRAIPDAAVSRSHLAVHVAPDLTVTVQENPEATNRLLVDDQPIDGKAVVGPDQELRLGDSVLVCGPMQAPPPPKIDRLGQVAFHRTPLRPSRAEDVDLPKINKVPTEPEPARFSWLATLAPLVGGILMAVVLQEPRFLIFVIIAPLTGAAGYFESKKRNRERHGRETETFEKKFTEREEKLRRGVRRRGDGPPGRRPRPGRPAPAGREPRPVAVVAAARHPRVPSAPRRARPGRHPHHRRARRRRRYRAPRTAGRDRGALRRLRPGADHRAARGPRRGRHPGPSARGVVAGPPPAAPGRVPAQSRGPGGRGRRRCRDRPGRLVAVGAPHALDRVADRRAAPGDRQGDGRQAAPGRAGGGRVPGGDVGPQRRPPLAVDPRGDRPDDRARPAPGRPGARPVARGGDLGAVGERHGRPRPAAVQGGGRAGRPQRGGRRAPVAAVVHRSGDPDRVVHRRRGGAVVARCGRPFDRPVARRVVGDGDGVDPPGGAAVRGPRCRRDHPAVGAEGVGGRPAGRCRLLDPDDRRHRGRRSAHARPGVRRSPRPDRRHLGCGQERADPVAGRRADRLPVAPRREPDVHRLQGRLGQRGLQGPAPHLGPGHRPRRVVGPAGPGVAAGRAAPPRQPVQRARRQGHGRDAQAAPRRGAAVAGDRDRRVRHPGEAARRSSWPT